MERVNLFNGPMPITSAAAVARCGYQAFAFNAEISPNIGKLESAQIILSARYDFTGNQEGKS